MPVSPSIGQEQLNWQVGRVPRQPFGPLPVDDVARVVEWLPARVPGDVRADLIAAGRLGPLDSPSGVAASEWVDKWDWWYRLVLPPGLSPADHHILEADGIDYYSAVWLDGRLLAAHAGMFSRQTVLLSPGSNGPGPHELRIRVWGGGALPAAPSGPAIRVVRGLVSRLSPGTEYFPQRMEVPKAQYSFGWDFSPRVLSCGIWDDVRLVSCRGAHIEDIWAVAEPLQATDPTPARWRVRLTIRRFSSQSLSGRITVTELDGTPLCVFTQPDLDGSTPVLTFQGPELHRWWPWDQGVPHLYRLTVQLYDDQGTIDERSLTTGVRTVTREALANSRPWRFMINNRHVFLRGANWVPADVLPGRVAPHDYRALLLTARKAGINFLRVWGGGIREKQAFWDECDRLGILAWQEFPLACAFLDHYPRKASYLDALEQEARGTARLLRNHPSLLAWCGGNEINPERNAAPLGTLKNVLAAEDPDRPWIPASPLVREGEVHEWNVWHGGAPWPSLADRTDAFTSEFGLQALPQRATIDEMFGGKAPFFTSKRWAERKAQVTKLCRYSGPAFEASLDSAISETQRVQSAALQAAIESCRIRREPAAASSSGRHQPCGGVAFWQFNEPWPSVSWSVVDHARRPKLAYEMLAHAYQPVLIAARFVRRRYEAGDRLAVEIWLVNDGPDAHAPCRAEARLDGVVAWRVEDLVLAAGWADHAGRFEAHLSASPLVMTLELRSNERRLAHNLYDLQVPITSPPGLLSRLRRRLADWLVTG